MKVDLIESWGTDLTVVNAARVSFDNESDWETETVRVYDEEFDVWDEEEQYILSEKDRRLVNFLARERHTSCFEHQGATLRLKVPIFIARQIQRHRTFSYNEVSRRYVDTPPEFFWPDSWRKRAENVKQGSSDEEVTARRASDGSTVEDLSRYLVREAELVYNQIMQMGLAPELARMILPQNMYTEFYMSGNLRAWSHFLALRLDGHAQKEVQDVAQQVEALLRPLWPVSMQALMEH